MSHKLSSYVRTYRKGWALTQQELATLLGCVGAKYVSRIENDRRPPNVGVLLGCCLIFGQPPQELFPALYEQVEDSVIGNLYEFYQSLAADETPRGQRKRAVIEEALARATLIRRHNQPEVCPSTN